MMDYAKQVRDIEQLIDDGLYAQAVQTAGKALEGLYKDLYRQLRSHMPRAQLEKVLQIEEKKGRGKDVNRFALGEMVGLFQEAYLVTKLEQHLGLSLSFMKSFDPAWVLNLRNRATHEDAQILEEEAWLCYWQFYMLLKETRRPVPRPTLRQKQKKAPARTSEPRLVLSSDDWSRYAASLGKTLELDTRNFRVPVDILANRVVEYHEGQPRDEQQEGGSPWLEIAARSEEGLTVLLGDPGEGKTVCFVTLARKLVEDFQNDPSAPLPIRVRLTFYDKQDHSLKELIAEQLRFCGLKVDGVRDVSHLLSQRCFTVLLDGLNEVPDHVPLIGELSELVSQAPDSHYFLSCRRADYGRVKEPLQAHRAWQLQRFDAEDIRRFLEKYLETDPDRKARLEEWVADERLVEVLGTPFFLSLFADLDPTKSPSPANRAELCQLFVNDFQAREFKARPELQPAGDLWTILEEAALQMQELRETHLPMTQFEDVSRQVWMEQFYGQETTISRQDTMQALYRSPFLTREFGKVTFTHQLFRDFFAARALRRKSDLGDPASFARFVSDTWWDYTIVLLCGLLADTSQLLDNIVYEGTNYDLAVRCLRESKRFDLRALQNITEWMRKGHEFSNLLFLGPLIRALPEATKEWCLAETEAIMKTALSSEQAWGTNPFNTCVMFAGYGWPDAMKIMFRVAEEAFESSSEVEKGNSLLMLGHAQEWEKVRQAATDPSPYVRKMVTREILFVRSGREDADGLLGVVTQLSQDPEVGVRCAAMEAACSLSDKGGVDILKKGLTDCDANVRLAAFQGLMDAEGEQANEARAQAVVLLGDLLERLWCSCPEELSDDPTEQVLDALKEINSPESSDELLYAMMNGVAVPAFVAEVLTDRGDPRAIAALITEMMWEPEQHLADLNWLDVMERMIARRLDHPFRLAWFEALLIREQVFESVRSRTVKPSASGQSGRFDPRSALDEMVKVSEASRSALSLLLWSLLLAFDLNQNEDKNQLLDAAIGRLIEIDPTVLLEFSSGSWKELDLWVLSWGADKFAARLIQSASTLIDALPEDKRKELQSRYEKR
jgi:HEAT repeat protein